MGNAIQPLKGRHEEECVAIFKVGLLFCRIRTLRTLGIVLGMISLAEQQQQRIQSITTWVLRR